MKALSLGVETHTELACSSCWLPLPEVVEHRSAYSGASEVKTTGAVERSLGREELP